MKLELSKNLDWPISFFYIEYRQVEQAQG